MVSCQVYEEVSLVDFSRFTVAENEGYISLNLSLSNSFVDGQEKVAGRLVPPAGKPAQLV